MQTKKQPATPLPWVVKSNARNLTVYSKAKGDDGQPRFVDEIPLEHWGDEAPRLRKDLTFAFHAANAYPRLVEALRFGLRAIEGKMARNVGLTAHEIAFRDEAEPLLRDLGEAE